MIVYGHRGAKGEAPENTLSGFAYGYHAGVRAFELDVRLTADQQIVLMHDASVDRTTNGSGAVAELTREQLAGLDARAGFNDWPEPCAVPTFAELLAVLPEDVRLEIEIKRDDPSRLEILGVGLVALIEQFAMAARVTVSSFNANALRIMRRLAPHLPRAYIGAYDQPQFLATALELECVQADIPLTTGSRTVVDEAHANGLRVTGWMGNTREQLQTLVEWKVEGITSDFPGIALPFLRERNLLK